MLVKQLRRAQDFIENALLHPHYQSREAGSCYGRKPAVTVSHKSAKSTAIRRIPVQTFSGLRGLRLRRRLLSLQWGSAAHVPIV